MYFFFIVSRCLLPVGAAAVLALKKAAKSGFADMIETHQKGIAPPDKRPWTEYDRKGQKQDRPGFKGPTCRLCLIYGPPCCVGECQWCWGEDNDQCCDICFHCECGRLPLFCCFGPQWNDCCCDSIQHKTCCFCCRTKAERSIARQECCECDCWKNCCAPVTPDASSSLATAPASSAQRVLKIAFAAKRNG